MGDLSHGFYRVSTILLVVQDFFSIHRIFQIRTVCVFFAAIGNEGIQQHRMFSALEVVGWIIFGRIIDSEMQEMRFDYMVLG